MTTLQTIDDVLQITSSKKWDGDWNGTIRPFVSIVELPKSCSFYSRTVRKEEELYSELTISVNKEENNDLSTINALAAIVDRVHSIALQAKRTIENCIKDLNGTVHEKVESDTATKN